LSVMLSVPIFTLKFSFVQTFDKTCTDKSQNSKEI
jgi:hypothetical protein